MSKRAKTKRQIYARRYVFSVGDEHHQIEADDVRDLVRQVTDLVPGTQRLSRWLNWPWTSGEQADLTVGRYRLVCVGQIVFELWGKLPKPVKEKAKRGIKLKLRPYPLRKKNPRNPGRAERFRCCEEGCLADGLHFHRRLLTKD